MGKVVFLILQYNSYEETILCLDSLLNNYNNNLFDIVLVDNNSTNDAYNIIKSKYEKFQNIIFIKNNKNLGFSKGNNVGFKYIKENMDADFIVMMNNDVIICQKDFIELLYSEYSSKKFDCAGPKIFDKNNVIYDFDMEFHNSKFYLKKTIKLMIQYLANAFYIADLKRKLSKKKKDKVLIDDNVKLEEEKNLVLHGCCLIFSKNYIDKFDGLDEKTFMYGEEQLLLLKLLNNHMCSWYCPKLEIIHLEDASVNKTVKNIRQKRMFKYKLMIKAFWIITKETKLYEIKLRGK